MEAPKLTRRIIRSQRLRAEYVRDVTKWLAWKWSMERALSEPVGTNINHK